MANPATRYSSRPRVNMETGIASQSSDEDLMQRFLAGDSKAFEMVYRRRRNGLRRFFEQQCGSRSVGQELAQDVWFKLLRACKRGQYMAEAKFTTYLYRLAKNHLIDWYRMNGDVKTVEFFDADEGNDEQIDPAFYSVEDPERIYADKERRVSLMQAVRTLPEVQRTTLLMQMQGDMSYDEIAEAMDTKKETVKTRLRYARNHLKRRILQEASQ